MEERILTIKEVADLLGASERCIQEWSKSGKLPCSRFPGSRKQYWLMSSIMERLKQNEGVQLRYKKRK